MNLELSGLELALELATRHNFEAADHLYGARQLSFDLEFAGGDMGVDLCVHAYDQKITSLDLATEAAIDLYRQIVTEFS